MGGGSGLWKTIILPPIFALLLYIATTYVLLPAYHRFRTQSNYTLLPSSLSPPSPESIPFARGLVDRVSTLLGRRRDSLNGPESLLGDEELEEGFGELSHSVSAQERNARIHNLPEVGSERRLSQELERGFRDSSDEDEDDDRGRVRR
ncbi:hypothetical protein ACLMJK_001588 [Lecanora helva]